MRLLTTIALALALAAPVAPAFASHGSDNCDGPCAALRAQEMRDRNSPTYPSRPTVGNGANRDTGSNLWAYSQRFGREDRQRNNAARDAQRSMDDNRSPRGSGYSFRPAQRGSVLRPQSRPESRPYRPGTQRGNIFD